MVYQRSLGWARLVAAAAASLAVWLWPQAGGWVIAIALLPWAVSLAAGERFRLPRLFILGTALFLVSALVGVWASFSPGAAWAKFWLMAAGGLVGLAVATLAEAEILPAAIAVGGLALPTGIYYLMAERFTGTGWSTGMSKFFSGVLPAPGLPLPPAHDIAGGLLAVFIPLLAGLIWEFKAQGKRLQFIALLLCAVFALGCLLLTRTLSAWLALAFGVCVWAVLLWASKQKMLGVSIDARRIVLLALLGAGVVSILLLLVPQPWMSQLAELPGIGKISGLLSLQRSFLLLSRDFFFTGGGLVSIAGLYSQYILGIPYFMFGYSHHIFLDVLLEQGILGLLGVLLILGSSIGVLVRALAEQKEDQTKGRLRVAVLAALVVILVNGLGDDPFYGQGGTPLLLVLPGLALTLSRSDRQQPVTTRKSWPWQVSLGTAVLAALAFLWGYRSIAASWEANLGAVAMARVQLNGWEGQPLPVKPLVAQKPALEAVFERSLVFDPANSTAHYRLGLLAMAVEDFSAAAGHLEAALQAGPNHRGVHKQLGYSSLWLGRVEDAEEHLASYSEIPDELAYYGWMWQTRGRDDLSRLALQLERQLEQAAPPGAAPE